MLPNLYKVCFFKGDCLRKDNCCFFITYRDPETVAASERASLFAKYFQPINDVLAQQNKLVETQRSQQLQYENQTPVFFTLANHGSRSGKSKSMPLYYSDSRYIGLGQDQIFRSTPTSLSTSQQVFQSSPSLTTSMTSRRVLQPTSSVEVTLPEYTARFRF